MKEYHVINPITDNAQTSMAFILIQGFLIISKFFLTTYQFFETALSHCLLLKALSLYIVMTVT